MNFLHLLVVNHYPTVDINNVVRASILFQELIQVFFKLFHRQYIAFLRLYFLLSPSITINILI